MIIIRWKTNHLNMLVHTEHLCICGEFLFEFMTFALDMVVCASGNRMVM